jgi:hypothetical protein
VELLAIKLVGKITFLGRSASPLILALRRSTATIPISLVGISMVDKGGFEYLATSIFDNPMIATSFGTEIPFVYKLLRAAIAIKSLATKKAVGRFFVLHKRLTSSMQTASSKAQSITQSGFTGKPAA